MVEIIDCFLFNEEESIENSKLAIEKRRPCIFRGLKLGDCLTKWSSPVYLSEQLKNKSAAIHVSMALDMDFLNKNFRYETLNMGELCRRVFSQGPLTEYFIDENEMYYLRTLGTDSRNDRSHFHEQFQELSSDLHIPQLYESGTYFSSVLRMSSSQLRLWNHYDVMDNILIEVVGRKVITFFSPYDAQYLYLQGDKSEVQDPTSFDEKKYPLMRHATPLTVEVNPGDVVFIPALWFHSVKSINPSVAVNVFWYHLPAELYDPKDVYGNRDPVPVTRAMQSITTCIKHMKILPEEYQHLFSCKLIDRLRLSLQSSTSSSDEDNRDLSESNNRNQNT